MHDHEVKKIYLNKTELAYILNTPDFEEEGAKKPFDNHINFIYVVQPFTQKFGRIHNGFAKQPSESQDHQISLFINDTYLVIA